MTDLEIVKKCAEKMGAYSERAASMIEFDAWADAMHYDPLHDDAQAMALVKSLRLTCMAAPMAGWLVHGGQDEAFTSKQSTDLNRAICECVARLP